MRIQRRSVSTKALAIVRPPRWKQEAGNMQKSTTAAVYVKDVVLL